jgi:tetratricopeptide (TPR) repeat protein
VRARVRLDRNFAAAHALIGFAKYVTGRGKETEPHVQEAFRLSPRDTSAHVWLVWVGNAKAQLGADEEAVTWMRRGLEANRNLAVSHFFLAAALAHLDRLDEAQAAAQSGLALDPSFTIRRFRLGAAADNPTYLAGRERIIEGMRKAGVPQG